MLVQIVPSTRKATADRVRVVLISPPNLHECFEHFKTVGNTPDCCFMSTMLLGMFPASPQSDEGQ